MSLRHPRRPAATLLAVLTLAGHVFPSPVQAQAPGATVRVATTAEPKQWITGRVAGETADSLAIVTTVRVSSRPQQGSPLHGSPSAPSTVTADTMWLARSDLHRVQVSQGRKSNAGRGALIGALALGVPVLIGAASCDPGDWFCDAGSIAAFTATSMAIGAGVGALIGLTSHRERWESVPITPAVGVGHDGGVRIGLAFDF